MNPAYLLLLGAILCEVAGTTALKLSDGFTRPGPMVVVAAGYGLSFFLLSLTLKTIPMGIAYGIWSGVGIVLISAIGWIWFRQGLDLAALTGLALIIAGVAIINLFSASAGH